MLRASLPRLALLPLGLLLISLGSGCQLIAGLGGEESKGTGGATGGTGPGGTGPGGTGGTGGGTSSGTGGTGLTGTCSPGESVDCYGGPAGTKDKGVCKGGTATCGEDGMWGACEGEVLPSIESCSSTDDEDCDGLDCNVWVKYIDSEVYGEALGIDGDGNVYAGIAVHAGVDLGDGDAVIPNGNSDAVVLKLDATGKVVWKKHFDAPGEQFIRAIAVAPDGSFAIAGESDSPIDLQTGQGTIAQGVFVAKYDADGNGQWAIAGQGNLLYISHAGIDKNGNVFAAGSATSVDFGLGPATSDNSNNIFIARFASATGQPDWLKITKATGDQSLTSMAIDGSGSAVLLGTTDGAAYLGFADASGTPPNDLFCNSSNSTIFLARIGPSGALSDGKVLQGSAAGLSVYLNDIAVDSIGDSIIPGSFTGAVTFQNSSYDAGSNQALVLVHDKTSGFEQSAKFFEVAGGYVAGNFVGLDSEASVSVAGNYGGEPDFGGGPLPGEGSSYLLKLDKDGNFLWNRSFLFGDGGIQNLATSTAQDETVLIGTYYGVANLGLGDHNAQQGLFIAKFGK